MVQNAVVGGLITLRCKDLRIISLKIKNSKEYFNVAASLEALSTLNNPELEYPFFYRPMYTILEDGYTIFRCVFCATGISIYCYLNIFFTIHSDNLGQSWNSQNSFPLVPATIYAVVVEVVVKAILLHSTIQVLFLQHFISQMVMTLQPHRLWLLLLQRQRWVANGALHILIKILNCAQPTVQFL